MPITFISYRREDAAGYAGRLHEELEQRLGAGQVFRDLDTLRPGQDFVEAIDDRLRNCGTFVAMIGRYWLNAADDKGTRRIDRPDDYVALEIAAALARLDVLVVPVLVGGATMPAADDLPERLRGLGRKQALVIRDETWEQDADRLAAILRGHGSGARPAIPTFVAERRLPRPAVLAAAALVIAVVGLGIYLVTRDSISPGPDGGGGTVDAGGGTVTGGGGAVNAGGGDGVNAPAPGATVEAGPVGSGHAVRVVGNPEFVTGETVYSIVTGSLVNRAQNALLSLRVRVSNDGRAAVGWGSDAFRLAINGELLPPASSAFFSEVVAGNSTTQKVVSFEVPPGAARADLRISMGSDSGTMPIDLRPSGKAPTHEQPDTSDLLARATIATLVSEPRPLLALDGFTATAQRITSRRFVNANRLTVAIRYENTGTGARGQWDVQLRAVAGSDMFAPVRAPAEVIAGLSTGTGEAVFDVPPAARSVTLRALSGDRSNEIPLTLP
jgi:hypothetical protein